MTFSPTPENILWLSFVMAQVAVLGRLTFERLLRVYQVLSIYLLTDATRFVVFLLLPPGRKYSAWLFVISQPVIWVLETCVLIELCLLIFRSHAGLARVGRWVIASGLAAAFLVSMATAPSTAPVADPNDSFKILFYYTAVERILDIGMVVFLLIMTVFLAWYPFTLNRNILVYFAGWAFSFIARSAAVVIPLATGRHITRTTNLVLEVVDLLCMMMWLVLINKAGENAERVSGYNWQPEHREQVRAQLQAMNDFLKKSQRQ